MIRVGTCAFSDHEGFYPQGLPAGERLRFYAQRFDLVEVDSTFYGLPRPATLERWLQATPDGFTMDIKAERRMTGHVRGIALGEQLGACREFAALFREFRQSGRMGPVLLQFPPWLARSPEAEDSVRALRAALEDFPVSVEMRNRSWYGGGGEAFFALLREVGAAHVVADEPQVGQGSVPLVPAVTAETAILRLHGRNAETWYVRGGSSQDRFYYLYSPEELAALRRTAQELARSAGEVHVLFNNNHGDFAIRGALSMQQMLGLGLRPPADPGLFDGD